MKQLFPGFVPNSVLRFCSLLGPPKISVAAKLWAGARKPPKKPPRTEEFQWKFEFGPPPERVLDGDEVCLSRHWLVLLFGHSLIFPQKSFLTSEHTRAAATESSSHAAHSSVQVDPETRAWRFGPAQMWYDALGVSEDGRDLDYGFKLKVSDLLATLH